MEELELFDDIELMQNVNEFRKLRDEKTQQGKDAIVEFEKELNKDMLNHAKKNKDLKTIKYKKAKK